MMRDPGSCELDTHNNTPRPMEESTTFPARTTHRQRRYDDMDRKRSDARRVARFHEECVMKARVFSALPLPSPLVDPAGVVDQIVDACNGDFGQVLYASATSPRNQPLFQSLFPDGGPLVPAFEAEDNLRAKITTQQKREDDARNEVADDARYLLASFKAWIYMLRRAKRQKKTISKCTAFLERLTRWSQSLYLLMRGSRRLRFLAVSRRNRQYQSDAVDAYVACRRMAEPYDSMFS
jgi:hypothetical protein